VLDQHKDPARLGDIVAATVDLSPGRACVAAGRDRVRSGCADCLVLLQRKVERIKVKQKIDSQVREEFSKHSARPVLRQKLKAIQDELGEGEDASDLARSREDQGRQMPEEVREDRRAKQLERLKQMAQSSASTQCSGPTSVARRAAVEQAD